MGCDIHCYLEVKKYRHDDDEKQSGVWVNADTWKIDPYAVVYGEPHRVERINPVILYRLYDQFAILANVRNYGGITPISEPRGLPHDVSPDVRNESNHYGVDGHSHSWLTLAELQEKPLRHYCEEPSKYLVEEWMDMLKGLSERAKEEHVEADEIRIVFWFDN